jgi:hypothetical protein
MPSILDFTRPHTILQNQSRKNLRLILWAGDGEHDGISDVERLPNYDVYVCLGFQGPRFDKNVASLVDSQTICILDIHNEEQMVRFHNAFKGSFAHIDADYKGNTPTLPLSSYASLLMPGGRAFHTEGINGLRMPEEDLLNTLEIFAPVLSSELADKRRWSSIVLEIAKGSEITPGEVWESPDLKNPVYESILDRQNRFVQWQSERNAAWPRCADSLEEQWGSLADRVLTWGIVNDSRIMDAIWPHLVTFSDYLAQRIRDIMLEKQMGRYDYFAEYEKMGDVVAGIRFKQKVLKWLLYEVPVGLTSHIGYYTDMRFSEGYTAFGLYYVAAPLELIS